MGDRSSLTLLGGQPELLRRVSAVAKKTIVVLIGGRPITFETGQCVANSKPAQAGVGFPWDPNESVGAACLVDSLLSNVSALLVAWRPGAEGGTALINLLSGAVNPSGHLSVSWPRSVGGLGSQTPYLQQLQLHWRETYQEEPSTPLFRFGHGLSYSNFTLGSPQLLSLQREPIDQPVGANDTVILAVNITNSQGPRGTAVLQVYYQQATAPVIRYIQQLLRYKRVVLDPGLSMVVEFEVVVRDMAYWNNQEDGYLPGEVGWQLGTKGRLSTFFLMVGLSAAECQGPNACDLHSAQLNVNP
jgi:beta-glucosidase